MWSLLRRDGLLCAFLLLAASPVLVKSFGSLLPSATATNRRLAFRNTRAAPTSPLFRRISQAKSDRRMSEDGDTDSTSQKSEKRFLQWVDDGGMALKPAALEAGSKANDSTSQLRKVMFKSKSYALFALFIVYRAYRGFFVILPEVFRQTRAKLNSSLETRPFADPSTGEDDIDPKTGKVRVRTTITVTILSTIVTASYVIGGAFRVVRKFIGTILGTKSASSSFLAAADELNKSQDRIQSLADTETTEDDDMDRLAP